MLKNVIVAVCLVCAAGTANAAVFTRAEVSGYGSSTPMERVDTGQVATPRSEAEVDYSAYSANLSRVITSSAQAYADLSTGKLGAFTTADSATGTARASFEDELYFQGLSTLGTPNISIAFEIDFFGALTSTAGEAVGYLQYQIGGAGFAMERRHTRFSGEPERRERFTSSNNGWESFEILGSGDSRTARVTYSLPTNSSSLRVWGALGSSASEAATSDFIHTSAIRLSLPTGVTFTSASGSFLTSAVPEPTSWAMMIVGFGAIGGVIRSARTRRASPATA